MSLNHYKFPAQITTCAQGHEVLNDFYHFCLQRQNCCVTLDWNELTYMEANLSALLLCMGHRLKQERGLKFFLDVKQLSGGLGVFWRNGFAHWFLGNSGKPSDARESTIPVKAFRIADVDSFASFITTDLLRHRGVGEMRFADKQRVKDSYFEIFSNVELHAKTKDPVLACGQFFPRQQELKFTLVDMGCGFLSNIAEHTKNSEKPIKFAAEAIGWAVRGNSTKREAVGGTGLLNILNYCRKNNGGLHIVSDSCYWAFDNGSINSWNLKRNFVGTTIHLIFRSS